MSNRLRKSPLKRKTPMKKYRAKPRAGRLKGEALAQMRQEVFERDGNRCQNCGRLATDLAHKRNKRMHGDSPENTGAWCRECHRKFHDYGPSMTKPCPVKPVERGE